MELVQECYVNRGLIHWEDVPLRVVICRYATLHTGSDAKAERELLVGIIV